MSHDAIQTKAPTVTYEQHHCLWKNAEKMLISEIKGYDLPAIRGVIAAWAGKSMLALIELAWLKIAVWMI